MSGPCGFGDVYECPDCLKRWYKESWHYFVPGGWSDGCPPRSWVGRSTHTGFFKCTCGRYNWLYSCKKVESMVGMGGPQGFSGNSRNEIHPGTGLPRGQLLLDVNSNVIEAEDFSPLPEDETLKAAIWLDLDLKIDKEQRRSMLLFSLWDCNDVLKRRDSESAWPKNKEHEWLIHSLLECQEDSSDGMCLKTELFRYLGMEKEARMILDQNKDKEHAYFVFQEWMFNHGKVGVYPVMNIDNIEEHLEDIKSRGEAHGSGRQG